MNCIAVRDRVVGTRVGAHGATWLLIAHFARRAHVSLNLVTLPKFLLLATEQLPARVSS